MPKNTAFVLFALVWLTMFCQCRPSSPEGSDGYGPEFPMTEETGLLVDSSMSFLRSDPARAHRILDSLCTARMISPQRCDYYHAVVMHGGGQNADSALMICDRLLDGGEYAGDTYLEEEICVLASSITSERNRHIETLKYARRGIDLCHGHERMRGDEATLLARVGLSEQRLGRVSAARETYDKAYALLKEDQTFGGLIALISLMKKQARLYYDARDYDQMIRVLQEVLALVERFDRDPSFITERPETMLEAGAATRDFADFYECQMYGNLARAYRLKVEQGYSADRKADTDSVRLYIDKWSQTTGASAPLNRANVLRELYFLGRKEAFAEAKVAVADYYRGDSLVSEYVDYLSLLAEEAASRRDFTASNAFFQRALAVSDSIRQQDLLHALTEQMSANMVQAERLARQDAENKVSRQQVVIVLLSILLTLALLAGLVITFLVRKNRKNEEIIEMTQQDLCESQEEIKELSLQLEETKTDKIIGGMDGLYEHIQEVMTERQLYLKPELDIKMLAEEVCASRTHTSLCINTITGKSFRQWLSEYRVAMFVKMLKDYPNASIDDLMAQCGYKDQSTFRRQFKTTYGMTPGEYRKALLEQ